MRTQPQDTHEGQIEAASKPSPEDATGYVEALRQPARRAAKA